MSSLWICYKIEQKSLINDKVKTMQTSKIDVTVWELSEKCVNILSNYLSFIKQEHNLYWTKSISTFSFHAKHKRAKGGPNFNISTKNIHKTLSVDLLGGGSLHLEISVTQCNKKKHTFSSRIAWSLKMDK
jgi:hypothetical protein